jgi:hypothetical protein
MSEISAKSKNIWRATSAPRSAWVALGRGSEETYSTVQRGHMPSRPRGGTTGAAAQRLWPRRSLRYSIRSTAYGSTAVRQYGSTAVLGGCSRAFPGVRLRTRKPLLLGRSAGTRSCGGKLRPSGGGGPPIKKGAPSRRSAHQEGSSIEKVLPSRRELRVALHAHQRTPPLLVRPCWCQPNVRCVCVRPLLCVVHVCCSLRLAGRPPSPVTTPPLLSRHWLVRCGIRPPRVDSNAPMVAA